MREQSSCTDFLLSLNNLVFDFFFVNYRRFDLIEILIIISLLQDKRYDEK